MGDMTVRNLPDDIHDELRVRARQNNRSIEAEVRSMITSSIVSGSGGGIGSRLRDRFDQVTGDELSDIRSKVPHQTEADE